MKKIFLVVSALLISSCAFVKKEKEIEFIKPTKIYTNNSYVYLAGVHSARYLDTDDMAYIFNRKFSYFAKHKFYCSLNCVFENYLLESSPYLVQKPITNKRLYVYIYDFEPDFKTIHEGKMLLKAKFYLEDKGKYRTKDFDYQKHFHVKNFAGLMKEENIAMDTLIKALNEFIRKSV